MPAAMEAFEGMTFGADPELFVVDREGNFVCADGLIPGTKEEPYKVDGGAVQVDGMAAEFNIDPVTSYKEWGERLDCVQNELKKMLPNGYSLAAVPTAKFSPEAWEAAPDHAKVLGCSPDYNAWRLSVNPPPKDTEMVRHAGGHAHLGWTEHASPDDEDYYRSCIDLVRQLDWYLAAWSVSKDSDKLRRSMYGGAGAMRFKPYGVEYRTLSNFWLKNKSLRLEMWNRMQSALRNMSKCHYPTQFFDFNKTLIKGINTSDLDVTFVEMFYSPIVKAEG